MSEELRGGGNWTGDCKLGSFCYQCLGFLFNVLEENGRGKEEEEEEEEEETGIVIEHHAPATHLDLFRGHQAVFKSKFLCKLVRVTSSTYILNLFCSSIAANKEGQRDGERGRE